MILEYKKNRNKILPQQFETCDQHIGPFLYPFCATYQINPSLLVASSMIVSHHSLRTNSPATS